MRGAGFSFPVRSWPVLFPDRVCPIERPFPLIHCAYNYCPLSWIQRGRSSQLSACRRMQNHFHHLLTRRGSRSGQGLIGPCGFLVGILAWRRRRAGIGCGGRSLTLVVLVIPVQIEHGLEVAVVDSCKTKAVSVQVKALLWVLVCRALGVLLSYFFEVKCIIPPGRHFELFQIVLVFLLVGGGDDSISGSHWQLSISDTSVALHVT